MRAILLDWLVEVARRYRQAPETVFQATSLVDRFLATGRVAVSRDNFQCFGSVCLVLASKVEEAYRTEVTYEDLNEMCAGAYTKQQLANSEAVVLNGRRAGVALPSAHAGDVKHLLHPPCSPRLPYHRPDELRLPNAPAGEGNRGHRSSLRRGAPPRRPPRLLPAAPHAAPLPRARG